MLHLSAGMLEAGAAQRHEDKLTDVAGGKARGAWLPGSVTSDSLQPHGLQPTRLLCPWNCPVPEDQPDLAQALMGEMEPGLGPNRGVCQRLTHRPYEGPQLLPVGLDLLLQDIVFGDLLLQLRHTWPVLALADLLLQKSWLLSFATGPGVGSPTPTQHPPPPSIPISLEPIIQIEVNQKEKHQYSILTHIYGI